MDNKQFAWHSLILAAFCCELSTAAAPAITLPRTGISADEVALPVNDDDPLSRRTAAYYQEARHIPEENVIHLRRAGNKTALSPPEFGQLKSDINRLTPRHVQVYAVAWTQPYRVGCMSLTSALAFGFDEKYCSAKCGSTEASGYFNSSSTHPFDDHQLRPAMMLAGTGFEQTKALIDRGTAADYSQPEGTAYLPLPRALPVHRGKNALRLNFPADIKSSVRLLR